MGMRTKIGMIMAGSVLVLLAAGGFWHSFNARSASAMNVSLQDASGKPLRSLFDGMPVDKRYPEFKRLVAEQLVEVSPTGRSSEPQSVAAAKSMVRTRRACLQYLHCMRGPTRRRPV